MLFVMTSLMCWEAGDSCSVTESLADRGEALAVNNPNKRTLTFVIRSAFTSQEEGLAEQFCFSMRNV